MDLFIILKEAPFYRKSLTSKSHFLYSLVGVSVVSSCSTTVYKNRNRDSTYFNARYEIKYWITVQ